MNQSITYEILSVMPLTTEQGTYKSLCTIQQPNISVDGAGGQLYTPATNVPGLVNIPCMKAPTSPVRVQATEMKALEDIMSKVPLHVLLNGYYPAITPDLWALVDGVQYDIIGVESDSQSQMTRLELQLVEV